jgi:hypothetical protein
MKYSLIQGVSNMTAELGYVWGYSLVAYFKFWLQEYTLYLRQQNRHLFPLQHSLARAKSVPTS